MAIIRKISEHKLESDKKEEIKFEKLRVDGII